MIFGDDQGIIRENSVEFSKELDIKQLHDCLEKMREIRDRHHDRARKELNKACDRLDVAISKMNATL